MSGKNHKNEFFKWQSRSNDIKNVVFRSCMRDMYSVWELFCWFQYINGETIEGFLLPTFFFDKFTQTQTSLPVPSEINKIIHHYYKDLVRYGPDSTDIIIKSFTVKNPQNNYQCCVYYINTDTCTDFRQHIILTNPKYIEFKMHLMQ